MAGQLDEILSISSDRKMWRRHWESRLALRKQHVVQDELNLTYELRGTKIIQVAKEVDSPKETTALVYYIIRDIDSHFQLVFAVILHFLI